ncbi:hypothetical protein BGZ68_002516 [Mortierella alpina]|nr:hypothetical protein BGZ68_002516 [Mortierella alpina]
MTLPRRAPTPEDLIPAADPPTNSRLPQQDSRQRPMGRGNGSMFGQADSSDDPPQQLTAVSSSRLTNSVAPRMESKDQSWGFEFDVEAMAQNEPRQGYTSDEQQDFDSTSTQEDNWFTDNDPSKLQGVADIAPTGWDEGEEPPEWGRHHQWYSTEEETIDMDMRDKEGRPGNQGRADDVWEVGKSLQWTAEEDNAVAATEEELVLDELTRYWASPNVIDVIRPKRPQEAFAEKPSVRSESDSWGTPQPVMAYNGEGYTSDVLIEQSNRKFWTMRNGEWFLLNESIDTTITHQQQERVVSWTSADSEEKHGPADYDSWDDSDSYYDPSDDSRDDPYGSGSDPNPRHSLTQDPFEFDYAGFVGEDEWRKPVADRKSSSVSPRRDPLWSMDSADSSQSPQESPSPSLEPTMPDIMPDFSTAKPCDNVVLSDRSESIVPHIEAAQPPLENALPHDSTLIDLLADSEDDVQDSSVQHNGVSSLEPSLLDLTFAVDGKASSWDAFAKSHPGTEAATSALVDTGSLLIDTDVDGVPSCSVGTPTITSHIAETSSKVDDLIAIDSASPVLTTPELATIAKVPSLLEQDVEELSSTLPGVGMTLSPTPTLPPTPALSQTPPKATVSSTSLDALSELSSPHEWLNQMAKRNLQQFEESRADNRQQWDALMAKQEEDSRKIHDFIQKAADKPSVATTSRAKAARIKGPISIAVVVETKDFGKQEMRVTNQDDLKESVEKFCAQYNMHSYEMALWVTVASALKQRKKKLWAERKLAEGVLS